MQADKFHLGWFMNGYRVHGWRDQWIGTHKSEGMLPDFYVDMARSLERACFDYFILEDSSFVPDAWQGKHDFYLENAYAVPKFDPSVLASILTQNTSRLGIVATLAITEYPPYLLARLVSTMDHVSRGRAGWNMVTASSDRAAQNYGHDAQPDHDVRYDMAEEFTELVVRLWESWEPGSMVVDQDGVFADPAKVHPVDFRGRFYKSRGPINSARSPQGRSVIVQAGGSPKGRAFASKYADSIIASATTVEQMKEYRDDVRARAEAHGRDPDSVKVLFLVSPVLGETHQAAVDRRQQAQEEAAANPVTRLAGMGYATDIDFSVFDLDTPVKDLASQLVTNGHQSSLQQFVAHNGDRTLREVAAQSSTSAGQRVELLGTPSEVADQMGDVMATVGGDGFLLTQDVLTRRSISEVCDGLVPELQKRGLTRTSYTYEMFRDNLLEF
ncbi:NtaA/DmoA family FMN-dependent monooxygenase [Streptomyces cellulosae]|uniref:NtaA/DmoA family FMN-dependent monooxygenase n=1 Tax=Streptomyces cellulosae TaxID=1968 RepID=UPI000ABDD9B2|nr:NtaA/DmoA family FMN-dependent monooxygenase [Streptomyces cellulosae]